LAGLKGYQLVGILLGVFQKVRIRLLGTMEKSKLFQKSVVLWWDTFSYSYTSDCLLGKASMEFQFGSHPEI
jgi:hypothetical protein